MGHVCGPCLAREAWSSCATVSRMPIRRTAQGPLSRCGPSNASPASLHSSSSSSWACRERRVDAQPWVDISAQELQLFMHLPPNVLHWACECDVMFYCSPHSQLAEGCLQPLQRESPDLGEAWHLSSCRFSPTRISRFNNIRLLLVMDTPPHSEKERKPHVTASKSDEGSEDKPATFLPNPAQGMRCQLQRQEGPNPWRSRLLGSLSYSWLRRSRVS